MGLTLLALVFLFSFPGTAQKAQNNFYNVIVQDGADPSVYQHSDGYYYSTYTTGGDVRLWRHRTLSGMAAGESKTLWAGCCNLWAPEIQFINNTWVVYFAKDGDERKNHRMFVLTNIHKDPFQGEWTYSRIQDPKRDEWAIDGLVLQNKGKFYFIWSGWDNDKNPDQNLYIAPMKSLTEINGDRIKIAEPQFHWETNTSPKVNEGPEIIKRNGKINLVYSGSGSWGDSYLLGLITADENSNLLDPKSWTKKSEPIFKSSKELFGPGHHSFTRSADGKEDWLVYHVARWQGSGWTREIRTQRFSWNSDSTPNLGQPLTPNKPIALPSGEGPHLRLEAEKAKVIGNAKILESKVGFIDRPEDGVEFLVSVKKAGIYTLSLRNGNGSGEYAVLSLKVNGEKQPDLHVAHSGWDRWSNAMTRVQLKTGVNRIRFSHQKNYVEIDSLDIF